MSQKELELRKKEANAQENQPNKKEEDSEPSDSEDYAQEDTDSEGSMISGSEADDSKSETAEKDVESPTLKKTRKESSIRKILKEKRKSSSNTFWSECFGEFAATFCTGIIVLGGIGVAYLAEPVYNKVMEYFS